MLIGKPYLAIITSNAVLENFKHENPVKPPHTSNPMGKVPSCSSCNIKLNYEDTPETSSRLYSDLSERKLVVVVGNFESNGRYFKPQFKLHFVLGEFLARPFSPGIESLGIENTLQADCVSAEGIKFFLLYFYFLLLALLAIYLREKHATLAITDQMSNED